MTAANPAWTLLAVDDEPNILGALRRLFRATGWRVLTAGHAEEALALLASEPVDAVLSDMRMPGMDGVQFLERVSRGWPRTARLLLTGQADLGSTIAAINRGGLHRYITKPWNDDELVLTLRQVALGQQLEAEKQALERLTQQQNDALKALNAGLEARVALRTEELDAANGRLKRNYLTSIKAFAALIELRGSAQVGHAPGGRPDAAHRAGDDAGCRHRARSADRRAAARHRPHRPQRCRAGAAGAPARP